MKTITTKSKEEHVPTMKDVAQEAGVALGTVSKVFSGAPVGEAYRERVEAAAAKLNYRVSRGKGKGGKTVAVLLPSVNHPFFAALAQHIGAALRAQDCRMALYITGSQPENERQSLRQLRQDRVDGVIAFTHNATLPVEDETLPIISIDRCLGHQIPCVSSDNYGGGRLAAEKLLQLGCRKLAFLRMGSPELGETDKRGDGFEAVCRSRGVDYQVCRINDTEPIELFRAFFLSHMSGGKLDFDGVFCSTDLLAWRVKNMLGELGVVAPLDVQIIGFDGVRRFGGEELYCSTIVQPVEEMARTSVDLLLGGDRSHIPALVCLPVRYAPGGTTREWRRGGETALRAEVG
jgi:LacI family transcriptional regulator